MIAVWSRKAKPDMRPEPCHGRVSLTPSVPWIITGQSRGALAGARESQRSRPRRGSRGISQDLPLSFFRSSPSQTTSGAWRAVDRSHDLGPGHPVRLGDCICRPKKGNRGPSRVPFHPGEDLDRRQDDIDDDADQRGPQDSGGAGVAKLLVHDVAGLGVRLGRVREAGIIGQSWSAEALCRVAPNSRPGLDVAAENTVGAPPRRDRARRSDSGRRLRQSHRRWNQLS